MAASSQTNASNPQPAPGTNGSNGLAANWSERFPDPPKDILSVLKTFMETQERRVNHWKEYDEAIEEHLKQILTPAPPSPPLPAAEAAGQTTSPRSPTQADDGSSSSSSSSSIPQANGYHAEQSHTHNGHGHGHGSSHYDSKPLPLDDELMNRVISLVTSGLIDCGHETRTIALELTHNTDLQPVEAAGRGAALGRLVGSVQDAENRVLRKVVQRDQIRRTRAQAQAQSQRRRQQERAEAEDDASTATSTSPAAAASGNDDDDDDDADGEQLAQVQALQDEIKDIRESKIGDLLLEIRAEMTDLAI